MKKKKLKKLIVMLTIICLIIIPFANRAHSADKVIYDKVIVSTGDTLWTIASEYAGEKDDIRELIYDIKKTNNLSSAMIVPGQELLIPN